MPALVMQLVTMVLSFAVILIHGSQTSSNPNRAMVVAIEAETMVALCTPGSIHPDIGDTAATDFPIELAGWNYIRDEKMNRAASALNHLPLTKLPDFVNTMSLFNITELTLLRDACDANIASCITELGGYFSVDPRQGTAFVFLFRTLTTLLDHLLLRALFAKDNSIQKSVPVSGLQQHELLPSLLGPDLAFTIRVFLTRTLGLRTRSFSSLLLFPVPSSPNLLHLEASLHRPAASQPQLTLV